MILIKKKYLIANKMISVARYHISMLKYFPVDTPHLGSFRQVLDYDDG